MERLDHMGRLEQHKMHLEHLLDEALKESFPTSDPPSIARPEDISTGKPLNLEEVRWLNNQDN
jgi:hypothetical protein